MSAPMHVGAFLCNALEWVVDQYQAALDLKGPLIMTSTTIAKPRLTSLAPQFLVDDLERTIAYYRDVLGFAFGEPWAGFYAIGQRDGLELHIKQAPKNLAERQHRRDNEHLDASAGVEGSLYH